MGTFFGGVDESATGSLNLFWKVFHMPTKQTVTTTSLDELGDGYGFRKIRSALGVTAFGVNAIVMPPGFEGFFHYHDEQDELYFVHAGSARIEIGSGASMTTHELGEGGLCHVPAAVPRRVCNPSADDLVVLVVGGKDGYVGRDGQLVDMADLPRRQAFGAGA
jgi:mannose-6-phosphate isomerase-like protein (cupin superfamily)